MKSAKAKKWLAMQRMYSESNQPAAGGT